MSPPLDTSELEELFWALVHRPPAHWSMAKLERVLGTLLLLRTYGEEWEPWSEAQRRRRLAEVRELLRGHRASHPRPTVAQP